MSKIETPWGTPQTIKNVASGIIWYDTACHGGYHLSPERNALVPQALKESTWCQNGFEGWYEEDCDAEIVRTIFPDECM